MKQFTCEMCGSTDLMKQDGVFVCQSCGCKYSVEEARRMMVEGTVDVSGSTVKVDTSTELANLYQIARRARDDDNAESAERYYDMILMKDPTSWEATFYVVYFRAKKCRIMDIQSAAISVANCEDTVLKLIRDHVPASEQAAAVKEVVARSIDIAQLLANAARKHWDDMGTSIKSEHINELLGRLSAAFKILEVCGDQVERIWLSKDQTIAALAAYAWKALISLKEKVLLESDSRKKSIYSLAHKIEKYDPAFAKKYLTAEKCEQLESEISRLSSALLTTENPPRHFIMRALFCLILAVVMFIVALNNDGNFFASVAVAVCLMLALIFFGLSSGAESDYNEKDARVLRERLEKAKKELEALKK